jgi:hypothetical protein
MIDMTLQPASPRPNVPMVTVPSSSSQTLTVSAVYQLSEMGRKASLLAGGNGRALQQLSVQVPANRLHLVAVDRDGVARLRLQPRFERTAEDRIRRYDRPAIYDVPPTLDDLFRDAARNHELEAAYQRQLTAPHERRREAEQTRRMTLAVEFLADRSQRALIHPPPTPIRCVLGTPAGGLVFDVKTDVGPARELPAEAYRRFQSDFKARQARGRARRDEESARHDARTRAIEEWIARTGTEEQQARHAAGLLPVDEVIQALTDDAFAVLKDQPRYEPTAAEGLQAYLRSLTGRPDLVVAPLDFEVKGAPAPSATAAQWAVMGRLQSLVPDAVVTLRDHRISWRREPHLPALVRRGARVERAVGPFTLRREFAVPEV